MTATIAQNVTSLHNYLEDIKGIDDESSGNKVLMTIAKSGSSTKELIDSFLVTEDVSTNNCILNSEAIALVSEVRSSVPTGPIIQRIYKLLDTIIANSLSKGIGVDQYLESELDGVSIYTLIDKIMYY